MSSFVIDKKEFVKAAGIVSGIAYYAGDRFYMWDAEKNRKMDGEAIYEKFCECYRLNAESVAWQYRDEKPESDNGRYAQELADGFLIGKRIASDNGKLAKMIAKLQAFFSSVRYQIEEPKAEAKVTAFLNEVIAKLVGTLRYDQDSNWGELDLDD
jgi:hypothetical protein